MIRELVKGAASLTVNVAGALLQEVADKVPVVDQVARKVGLRSEPASSNEPSGVPPMAKNTAPTESAAVAPSDPPLPHSVSPTVAAVLEQPEGEPSVKPKRGQKHGHH
jgi:hypothetical protein